MRIAVFACLLGALSAAAAPATGPMFDADTLAAAEELRDDALSGTGAWEIVSSLTTEVGPRLAGSAGDRAAVAWALQTLRELGFENVRAENVEVPHWERGSINVRITEPFPQPLVATALGGSIGTPEQGVEAPVLQVADIAELEALPRSQVEGRIVFFNKRMRRARDGSGYGELVDARTKGAATASKVGAAAVVIRSIGTSTARVAHTGTTKYASDVRPIPAVAISNADADQLEAQLETGRRVALRIELTARNLPSERSANVIADVPGTDPDTGIVLLAAHLDSWDLGTGAVDDGAGVAIVIETARRLAAAKLPLVRTVRVLLAANEEFGLSGAEAYAQARTERVDGHVVGLESDFGSGRVWRFESRVAEHALPLVEAIHAVLAPLGIERGGNEANGGADLSPLRKRGMPVLGLNHDGTHYFDVHHTASDTLDKVDAGDLDQSVAAYTVTAFLAAVAPRDFGRIAPEPEAPDAETGETSGGGRRPADAKPSRTSSTDQ
ncbi:M28 family metallopeptidase [soil metagenome]